MSRRSKEELIQELMFEYRASQSAVDEMDEAACRALGINRTDGRCLDVIDREGPVTAGRIAEASGLTTAAVTSVLDRLEKAGLAQRVRDQHDRRRVLVEQTPLARRRGEQIYGPMMAASRELSRYSIAELELLRDFSRRAKEVNQKRAAEVRGMQFD